MNLQINTGKTLKAKQQQVMQPAHLWVSSLYKTFLNTSNRVSRTQKFKEFPGNLILNKALYVILVKATAHDYFFLEDPSLNGKLDTF